MKHVYIEYNPYKVTTKILIEGKPLKKNSRLNVPDQRLQEWIDNLPDILFEEESTRDFDITFKGTVLDYEDVLAVADNAEKKGMHIKVTHIRAKEVKDKEQAIADIFEEIKKGPFEELKQPALIRSFENAKNKDFEVNVVATMSAGKSTLINALLAQKLMPTKQEACTATITRITDNDSKVFTAEVYDKNNKSIDKQSQLTYTIMNQLNSNPQVSRIEIKGNIPFVDSKEVSLVLIDTPGPNNANNPEHKKTTMKMLSESSKTVVLYILNATQLAVNDDSNLLSTVAESMKVGGKQSRDRFIFVVNRLDEFRKGEDSIDASLKKVRDYLEDFGVMNPNIYPASALTALDIRTTLAESDDEDDKDQEYIGEAENRVKKFSLYPEKHFEDYAPLPDSAKDIIAKRLAKAVKENDVKEQALCRSGVVSIEEAIRIYVLKYAKTAKIKNIVDTFAKKLESAESFERTKKEIASNRKIKEDLVKRIDSIEARLQSGNEAKKFKKEIDELNFDAQISEIANNVLTKAQAKITKNLTNPTRLSRDEAEDLCKKFTKFADDLQIKVQIELEELIENSVQMSADQLLQRYEKKLAGLVDEIKVGEVELDPFEIMKGEIPSNISSIITDSVKTEKVKTGDRWINNDDKKWYKPWTWFDEPGHYQSIYENREFIDGKELAEKYFAPIEEQLFENSDSALKYAQKETKQIKRVFAKKFDELDELLGKKLDELKAYATNEKDAQKKLDEAKSRLEWLDAIQNKVNAILEI